MLGLPASALRTLTIIGMVLAITPAEGRCADQAVARRSIAMSDSSDDMIRVRVPAGTPVELIFSFEGGHSVVVHSPELGLFGLKVPMTKPIRPGVRMRHAFDLRRVRHRSPPLKRGKYPITCDCRNGAEIALVVVE